MTAYTRRLLIVVPASEQAAANTRAKEVDTAGGERTFTAGLVPVGSPSGTAPSHYWCGWTVTQAEFDAIRSRLDTAALRKKGIRIYDAATWTPEAVLADLGLAQLAMPPPEGAA